MKINIVFPVLNEELRLEKGITTLIRFLDSYNEIQYVITIVDNGSVDKTSMIAKKLCSIYDNVTYMRIEERGVGIAFRTAVKHNSCEIIGYTDIDLSTELAAFVKMYNLFKEDSRLDIVNASRYSKDSTLLGRKWYRNAVSYILIGILKSVFHMRATDAICGFKFFRKKCIENLLEVSSDEKGWFLLIEILIRAEKNGCKIKELPVVWIYEEHTKVKIFKVSRNYIQQIIKLRKELNKGKQ